jgi:hypothetical protein
MFEKISFNDYKLTTSGFIKTSFKNVHIENHQTVGQWCKLYYRVNYIFLFAVDRWALLLHYNAVLPDSQLHDATSHDTNYKILVAKRNDKIIRWLSRLTENSEAQKVHRVGS